MKDVFGAMIVIGLGFAFCGVVHFLALMWLLR